MKNLKQKTKTKKEEKNIKHQALPLAPSVAEPGHRRCSQGRKCLRWLKQGLREGGFCRIAFLKVNCLKAFEGFEGLLGLFSCLFFVVRFFKVFWKRFLCFLRG